MRGAARNVLAQELADQAVHQLVDGVAEDLGTEDLAGCAEERDNGHEPDPLALGLQLAKEPEERGAEVLGLLGRDHHAAHRAETTRAAATAARTAGNGRALG